MDEGIINENNKLIAEFMVPNWADLKKDDYSNTIKQEDLYVAANLCSNNIEFLKYECSWNWLIPVVEKISKLPKIKIGLESICGNYKFVITGIESSWPGDSLIKEVYGTIIKFIKKYNEQINNN